MFCLRYSFAINLMGKRELVALLSLSPLCLVIAVWLSLAVPWVCLHFVIVVFSNLIHLLFQTVTPKNYFSISNQLILLFFQV